MESARDGGSGSSSDEEMDWEEVDIQDRAEEDVGLEIVLEKGKEGDIFKEAAKRYVACISCS
jgi:hypothetical protein